VRALARTYVAAERELVGIVRITADVNAVRSADNKDTKERMKLSIEMDKKTSVAQIMRTRRQISGIDFRPLDAAPQEVFSFQVLGFHHT
jgi:hypothetical protein